MKKIITIIVLVIILVAGVFITFTYQLPETKAYTTLDKVDTSINTTLNADDHSFAQTLINLQSSVENLITIGETYTDGTDVTQAFKDFNTAYEQSKTAEKDLADLLNKEPITKIEADSSKLSEDLKSLENEALTQQNNRVTQLTALLQQLQDLNTKLADLETKFYVKKPSEAIQYFNSLTNEFEAIKNVYQQYIDATTQYMDAKLALYNAIKA